MEGRGGTIELHWVLQSGKSCKLTSCPGEVFVEILRLFKAFVALLHDCNAFKVHIKYIIFAVFVA